MERKPILQVSEKRQNNLKAPVDLLPEFRVYPEGWTMDEGRDSTLEYRLSIIHAVEDDTGKYTCITPARYEHTINIVVKVRFFLPHRILLQTVLADFNCETT